LWSGIAGTGYYWDMEYDAELVAQCGAGDRAAFATIVGRYQQAVHAIAHLTEADRRDFVDILAQTRTETCVKERWSEARRVCVATADDYHRAKIDCSVAEVAALPPELGCQVLVQHMIAVQSSGPELLELLGHATTAAERDGLRAKLVNECDERPWSIEHRRCSGPHPGELNACGE
jgi:hypothetical protein